MNRLDPKAIAITALVNGTLFAFGGIVASFAIGYAIGRSHVITEPTAEASRYTFDPTLELDALTRLLDQMPYEERIADLREARAYFVGENTDTDYDIARAVMELGDEKHEFFERFMRENQLSPDGTTSFGWTLLCLAAFQGKAKAVEFLVASGADVNLRSSDTHTPLWSAAVGENAYIIQKLARRGADLEAKVNDQTPLQIAAQNLNIQTCATLLAEGADPNTIDRPSLGSSPEASVIRSLLQHYTPSTKSTKPTPSKPAPYQSIPTGRTETPITTKPITPPNPTNIREQARTQAQTDTQRRNAQRSTPPH